MDDGVLLVRKHVIYYFVAQSFVVFSSGMVFTRRVTLFYKVFFQRARATCTLLVHMSEIDVPVLQFVCLVRRSKCVKTFVLKATFLWLFLHVCSDKDVDVIVYIYFPHLQFYPHSSKDTYILLTSRDVLKKTS